MAPRTATKRPSVKQVFPRRVNGAIEHIAWEVDVESMARMGGMSRACVQREVTEMGEHFPRWIATVAVGNTRLLCKKCGGVVVFCRGVRCVACDTKAKPPRAAHAAWFGVMPPIGVDGLPRVAKALKKKAPAQHVVGHDKDLGNYLLVPLLAIYPSDFPTRAPSVFYAPGFFSIRGVPAAQPSHEVHLLSAGQMCLFAGGQWRKGMTCREVLQQRAYAHVIKMLNYADGQRSAFRKVS